MEQLTHDLSEVLGQKVESIDFFTSGQIGNIYKLHTKGCEYILKTSQPSDKLEVEAKMLTDLQAYDIAVPKVYDVSRTHLLMEYISPHTQAKCAQETEVAKLLTKLHSISNESRMYGYYYDTTIGPFTQNNEQTQYSWGLFLAQMRILPMVKVCYDKGRINKAMLERLEGLCRHLYKRIDMSAIRPSLLHGDIWSGNVLFNQQGAMLIDPAIYFGDKEMELAFILLFDTFGDTFFHTYNEVYQLSSDFYDVKVPLYQVYPLLVHVALYGSSYVNQLEQRLQRLGV